MVSRAVADVADIAEVHRWVIELARMSYMGTADATGRAVLARIDSVRRRLLAASNGRRPDREEIALLNEQERFVRQWILNREDDVVPRLAERDGIAFEIQTLPNGR